MRTLRPPTTETLLHHGGPPSAWGNLGLWSSADQPYADACRALADRVAAAAGLGPGQRVVSLACGSGEELRHWVQAHGVHSALGVEADAQRARRARRRMARAGLVAQCPVVVQPALAWAARRGAHDARFDAVLCVDAAYHLSPRLQLLSHALALLQPGARLAFTDLVLDRQAAAAPWLRATARLCGVPHVDLVPADERLRQLQAAGFVDVQAERLDDAVLGGFVRFVQQQHQLLGRDRWRAAWLRPAITAALIGPCRTAGLGYVLFSARRSMVPPSR